MTELDDHGQPRNKSFNWERNAERDIAELIGTCKGSLADGVVNAAEADYLRRWTLAHAALIDQHPFREIAVQLERIYRDGAITPDELTYLQKLLERITGWMGESAPEHPKSSRVQLDDPQPDIVFPERGFVLTG